MPQSVGRFVIVLVAAMPLAASTGLDNGDPVPAAVRSLGQAPPGSAPVRFAPGIVSTDAIEINGVFRHDFREFFFARHVDRVFTQTTTDADVFWVDMAVVDRLRR
jgi:hypothetical protein